MNEIGSFDLRNAKYSFRKVCISPLTTDARPTVTIEYLQLYTIDAWDELLNAIVQLLGPGLIIVKNAPLSPLIHLVYDQCSNIQCLQIDFPRDSPASVSFWFSLWYTTSDNNASTHRDVQEQTEDVWQEEPNGFGIG